MQKRYVLLVHKSEKVLELETEVKSSSVIVVVRVGLTVSFQVFCNVRRH